MVKRRPAVSIEVAAVIRVLDTFTMVPPVVASILVEEILVMVAAAVSREVTRVSRVPEAFTKTKVSKVEEGLRSSVEEAVP